MDCSRLPVAKRTRSNLDRILIERHLRERAKRLKNGGARVEAYKVSPFDCVDVEDSDDENESLSDQESQKGKRIVNNGASLKPDMDVHAESSDSDENYARNHSFSSDHNVSFDESTSYAKSEDEGIDDSDEIEYKKNGKIVEGGNKNGNVDTFELEKSRNGKICFSLEDQRNAGMKIKSGLRKIRETHNVADCIPSTSLKKSGREELNLTKDGQPITEAEEVVEILSSSSEADDQSGGEYVIRDGGERRKNLGMATRRKSDKDLDHLKVLGDSLNDEGEGLKILASKEKPVYKFRPFADKDEKPVEKSEFDKDIDQLFADLNMCLSCEQIGSTPVEVDNDDHIKTQSNWATRCSQGIHQLILDEQIGIICKYCSHVHLEIKHILPTFSTPSSQRRGKGYFVQSECPIFSDYFQGTGAENHRFEDYNTIGTVWDLIPGTRSSMFEHQQEGFEFIWKNLAGGIIIEDLEKPLSSSGSGCIISHAPGTGKTRLTIVFLQSFMKLYPDSRPVIIAPKSMLLTWEEEFKKWNVDIPFHNMNNLEFSGQENSAAVSVSKKIRGSRNNETVTRLVKLLSWKMDKSILGITYGLFDKLVGGATRNANCTPIVEQMGKALLKLPTLLVLDEGHTPRNNQSCIYNSLFDVETERRIILSGTPFQNNFDELYNTMCLVNPKFGRTSSKYGGSKKKDLRKFGQEFKSKWSFLTNLSGDVHHKLRELKCIIDPFVHVHKGTILQKNCPGLKDAMIHLRLTDLQEELISLLKTKKRITEPLAFSHAISLVSVHPSLLPNRWFQEHQFSSYRDRLERLKRDPYSGAKTKFVIELCRLSEALNEKVLVYAQFIDPLIFMKEQLQNHFKWIEGREVLYMDGSLEAKQRQSSISSLNDPRSKVRVLLASIKACCEGIHLVGASRVVLMDVVWNPSVERQAISRAYRLGQKKIVYTYHLIAEEEMEVDRYKRQIEKDRLSEMVFSSKDMDICKENMPDMVSEDEILQEMFQRNEKLGGMFKQIIYHPKESNLVDTFENLSFVGANC